MQIISKIYKNLDNKEKKSSLLVLLSIITLLLLDFLSIGLIFPLISSIFNDQFYTNITQKTFFEGWEKNKIIYFFLILLFTAFLLKNIFFLIFNYLKKKTLANIQFSFSSRIFKGYISQKYSIFLKKNKSELLRNVSLVNEYTYILENFINIFIEFLILIFIFVLIFLTSFKVGFILITFIFILVGIIILFSYKRLNWYGQKLNIQAQRLLNNFLNIFGSIREIILSKKQSFFNEIFKEDMKINLQNEVKSGFVIDLPRVLIELTLIVLLSLIIFLNLETSNDYNVFLSKIAFLGALLLRAMPSISKILYQGGNISLKYNKLIIVNNLINELEKEKLPSEEKTNSYKQKEFNNIKLENVSFYYNKNINILEDINLEIKKNEVVGIFSRSGSGKSTLLDLISGLLQPSMGRILLNDKIILKNEELSIFQNSLSYISQNNYLLNESIKNNIVFGQKENEVDFEKINSVLEIAKLREFVESKQDKINFQIGDNGKNISGGQRQRIIIARAIYRNADILLFDEPTTSLDSNTEIEIMRDIKEYFYRKKTIIICSHNLELLNFCDVIYKIDNKKLIKINK